jgi:dihydrofolate reductase
VRKVIAWEFVSLDGVMESPETWIPSYMGDEMEEASRAGRAASDAMLLGRKTYQTFAGYWPHQTGEAGSIADHINATPKHVVSTTLDAVEWQNSTLIRGNVAEEVLRLKHKPGKNITILGSGTLVRSLLRDDLIDEIGLMVFPIVLGSGKRLFDDGGAQKRLELVDSKTFGTGVLSLTYRLADDAGSVS